MAELQASMSGIEFGQWQVFLANEPITQREDINTARILSMLANCAGAKTKVTDFMVDYWAEDKPKADPFDAALSALRAIRAGAPKA